MFSLGFRRFFLHVLILTLSTLVRCQNLYRAPGNNGLYLGWSPSSWDFRWGVEVGFLSSRSPAISQLVNRKLQRSWRRRRRVSGHAHFVVEKREILIDVFLLFLDSRFRRLLISGSGVVRLLRPLWLVEMTVLNWVYYHGSDIMSYLVFFVRI